MADRHAAPSEADVPRPLARAILHARIPASFKLLLLALLAALSLAEAPRRMLRLPRKDWFIAAHTPAGEARHTPLDWYELRRLRRARAELGWLLRGKPNRGMSILGHRAPELRPMRLARAPPCHPRARTSPRSRRENPASRGEHPCPER